MTNKERITELEDAVIRLSYLVEHKSGAYGDDVNPAIRAEGLLIHSWARSVQERRGGT